MINNVGFVRRIDDLGRVVIPKEIRRIIKIEEGEPLEIFVDSEKQEVTIKKHIEPLSREEALDEALKLLYDFRNNTPYQSYKDGLDKIIERVESL
jgi:AbrB family looped-hinge helix DNA binding protein